MAKDLLLSDKEKARLKQVRLSLANGANPYSDMDRTRANADQGGLDKDRAERRAAALLVQATRSEVRTLELEHKWQDRSNPLGETVYLDPSEFPDLFGDTELPAHIVVCSFCKQITSNITATRGIGQPRKIIKTEIVTVNDVKTIEERVSHVADKVVACPACIGHIKPVTQRCGCIAGCATCKYTGRVILNSGITWPDSEG